MNLAARLCEVAATGAVLADAATASPWRTHGTAVEAGSRTFKGMSEPVAVWTVLAGADDQR